MKVSSLPSRRYLLLLSLAFAGVSVAAITLPRADAAATQDAQSVLRARLQVKLDSLHAAGRFPGATFSVALPDGGVVSVATGSSDTALKLAMTTTDRMPQGSVGKTYVSAVALQLVHEKKLDLDALISRYVGSEAWFSRLPNAREITVRHLMTHTSGLIRYEFNPRFTADLTAAPPDKVWDPRDLIAYIYDTPAPFRPGAGWDYSDTNYMVLGLIIEKITGRTLVGEIQRRIVAPLQLQNTVPNLAPSVPGIVQGYAGPRNPFGGSDAMLSAGRFSFNPQFEWAGGGWSSTTGDLAKWGKLLYEWKAFDASLAPRFLDAVASTLGQNVRYGLGVMIWPAPATAVSLGEAYGHSGFFPGYQTELRYYPRYRFAAALQVNSSNGRVVPGGLGAAIAQLSSIVAGPAGNPSP